MIRARRGKFRNTNAHILVATVWGTAVASTPWSSTIVAIRLVTEKLLPDVLPERTFAGRFIQMTRKLEPHGALTGVSPARATRYPRLVANLAGTKPATCSRQPSAYTRVLSEP